jgi:hypothetical protein
MVSNVSGCHRSMVIEQSAGRHDRWMAMGSVKCHNCLKAQRMQKDELLGYFPKVLKRIYINAVKPQHTGVDTNDQTPCSTANCGHAWTKKSRCRICLYSGIEDLSLQSNAIFGMVLRFLTGLAVMAVASIASDL